MKEIEEYLDNRILEFSDDTLWTTRDAVRGVQIFGSIGSGKSSGSGEFIAKKYLGAGWGGLVLCAKPDEAKNWYRYVKECNRPESDIIHFFEGSDCQFNPLSYESERVSRGGGLTMNLTELFMSIFKMGQRITGSDSEEHERFWENALKRLINRTIDLIRLSDQQMSIANMVEIIGSAPHNLQEISELKSSIVKIDPKTNEEFEDRQKLKNLIDTNFFFKCWHEAQNNTVSDAEKRDSKLVTNYFLRDYPLLDEKAQSTIREMFLGFAEPFLSGILNDHFSSTINVKPEDTFVGKIIILDFSVKEYLVAGIYAQCLFKYLWQQAIERRKITATSKPVFLWIDESHYFVNEHDTIFQTTARSSMACSVFLTQNISNYYMQMGGRNVKAKVDSLLGNLGTLIFHNNSDAVTNEWASRLIGSDKEALDNSQTSAALYSTDISNTESKNTQYLPQVQPRIFTMLKTGGKKNEGKVSAIIFIGRAWNEGRNFREETFEQSKNNSNENTE